MVPAPSSDRAAAAPGGALNRPGVLLLGHGSTRSGASAEPIFELAEGLRSRGFPEVRTAFWKEETFLHQALDTLRSSSVVVLPVFLAEGYFTRTVVPRELGLAYGENRLDGRTVRLLHPLGTAPSLDEVVLDRARAAIGAAGTLADARLIVLGHGTPRDEGSALAVLRVCDRLAARRSAGHVVPAFIDQAPYVADAMRGAGERLLVVVPFLVAAGWHGGTTVPQDLGLETAGSSGDGGRVLYAEPVGTHPRVAEVVEGMLLEAAGRTDAPDQPTPLAAATEAFAARSAQHGAVRLLQVVVRPELGGWEIRHAVDVGASADQLEELGDAAALERRARCTAAGAHRPLRTAADLAPGWRAHASTPEALADALVALYGPALTDWQRARIGAVRPSGFRETAARQTGIYARLAHVEPAAVHQAVARVCDGWPCLRRRMWTVEGSRADEGADNAKAQGGTLAVPCPAPCPVLLTTVLELSGEIDLENRPDRVDA